MKLIAKKEFTLNDKYYEKGNEVKVNTYEELRYLNEKGFIEPLSRKQLEEYFNNKEKEEL